MIDTIENSSEIIDSKEIILFFRENFNLTYQIFAFIYNFELNEYNIESPNKSQEELKTSINDKPIQFESFKTIVFNNNVDSKVINFFK